LTLVRYFGRATAVTVWKEIRSIRHCCFCECRLSALTFEAGSQLAVIEASAFESCTLAKVTIPQAVLPIGDSCFVNSRLTALELEADSQLVKLRKECFRGCRIKTIAIPRFVQIVGERAFASCDNLLTITFDKDAKVAAIQEYCFENCASINNIQIPASVRAIGKGGFCGCRALATLAWDAAEQQVEIATGAFKSCPLKAARVPKGSKVFDQTFDKKVAVTVN
jgi:hypothetical protein